MPFTLSAFQTEIEKTTCERGYDFYCEGRIKSIYRINPIEWQAVVQGFDDHTILLKIQKDKIEDWQCDCSEENICKHIVAVLYFIREEGELALVHYGDGFEEVRESLSYLPPHVLRYLILKYAAENKSFRKYLDEYFKTQK